MESTFGICSNRRFVAGDERLFTSHAAAGKGNFFADRCGQMEQRQAPPDQSQWFYRDRNAEACKAR